MNLEHHDSVMRREPRVAATLAELRALDDPHIRDIGTRWDAVSPEDVGLYEHYTALQSRFDEQSSRALEDVFYAEVESLVSALQRRQEATRSLSPDSATANMVGFLGTKIGGLYGKLQVERMRARRKKQAAM